MPVTMRYSASLDRTYEEGGGEVSASSQVQEASSPPVDQTFSTSHGNAFPAADCQNEQLWNGDEREKKSMGEEGLSDSMDSLALDLDDSNSSTSGHSRQHSSDGGGSSSPSSSSGTYGARPLTTLSPRAPSFNPLQFVKTSASPLVKKAEQQIKQYEEVKKVKELVKEEAEEWQSNLDVWKSRRRQSVQKSVQRVEEGKQIEEELDKLKKKSKTFSEMMQERSRRGSSKSLPVVYAADDWPHQVPSLGDEENFEDLQHSEKPQSNGNGVVNNQNGHKSSQNGHNGVDPQEKQLSGFEEAIRSYAEYAEETNNKAKAQSNAMVKNHHNELQLNLNEEDYNSENQTPKNGFAAKEVDDTKEIKNDTEETLVRENGQMLNFSILLRRQSEYKDFGFNVKNVKGMGTGVFIETVQPQSPAAVAGLLVNDEVLAINGEQCTTDRSHGAIVFAIKQAVYTGQLLLAVFRYDNPEIIVQHQNSSAIKEENHSNNEGPVTKVDVVKRRSLFERPTSPERTTNIVHRKSLDLSISLKDKVASFELSQHKHKSNEDLSFKKAPPKVDQLSSVNKNVTTEDNNTQVGSGLKFGFELASTLQETPIVDSVPSSPSIEQQIESFLDFGLMREEIEVVTNQESIGKPLEPPKEKPPPPPPPIQSNELDPSADPSCNKTVKLRRVESTKRILKEIHKRRSDFLGIEDEEFQKQMEQQMSQVSPPPNVDEMLLKMEKERLSVNINSSETSDNSLEHEIECDFLSPTSSFSTNTDDIDQKEREIIESLEQWEEEQIKINGKATNEAENLITNLSEVSTAVKLILAEPQYHEDSTTKREKTLEEKELELQQQEERLRNEKEKLRKEQEELMRQKEEYEKQIQRIQQQQIHLQTTAVQVSRQADPLPLAPKLSSPQAVPQETRKSKGLPPPPVVPKPKLNETLCLSSLDDDISSPPTFHPQILTKPNLVALSAPPKAKIMDGEEWMQPRRKRENYHQHWLVQEAEFRRLQAATQFKENEKLPPVEDRLLQYQTPPNSQSKHHVVEMEPPEQNLPQTQQQTNSIHVVVNDGKTQGHLQKAVAPRPPAKPIFSSHPLDKSLSPLSPSLNPSHNSSNQTSPASPNTNGDSQILSVSGKKRCSHCSIELGRGAAMIIESLKLFYHIGCFKCCVCHVQLGNGSSGTDVRVRSQKLHCHNCYSNDEGLKFSKV